MWDEREKRNNLQGHGRNFYSTGSELSLRENGRFVHPYDGSDGQFFAEASRKRKAMDSDMVNNVYDGVSPRFWANRSGNFGHLLPRELSSQHIAATIDSQRRPPEMFFDHNSQSTKPSNAQSQFGDYQFYNRNDSLMSLQGSDENFRDAAVDSSKPSNAQSQFGNYRFYNQNDSLMSLQGRDENFRDAAVDSSKSCTFLYNEPSFSMKTAAGGTPKLPDLRSHAFDMDKYSEASKFQSYYKQSGDHMEKTQAVLRSNIGMNSRFENNDLPSTQCPPETMPSRNLTFFESSKLRMINEEFNPSGGTSNCGQTSVRDGKEASGSYQYSNTEIRSAHYPFSGVLGAIQNVSGTQMLQMPVLTESSDRGDACVDNGMLKNTGHFSKDPETETVEKEDGSNTENKCHFLGEGTSPETDNTLASKPVEIGDSMPSQDLDEQSKQLAAKLSPVVIDKLWDGSLQLNTSTVVSTVAIFKSGEKAQDINWSEHIDIKGKVRLQAFEKFIQELPRSRNRALMVISLRWKVGSSKAGLTGMKEVSKGYRESGRVGFAQICPGIDLYVCPRSDTIITILAKYGFFKGMAAVEEDHDSFIGCVVWRRGHPASNSAPQKPERKRAPLPEQLVHSPESSIVETNSPLAIVNDSESKQATPCTREPDGCPGQSISDARSADHDNARDKTIETNVVQSSPQEAVEHVEIPVVHVPEPRNPDLGSESTRSILPGPPPMLPAIQQWNMQSDNDLHGRRDSHTGSVPALNPSIQFNSLIKPVQPLATTQWHGSSSREDPTGCVSKPDSGFGLKQPILPAPPQLPPGVLQRMLQSNRDAHQIGNLTKAEIPIMHITQPNIAAMFSGPMGPTIPPVPQSLPQCRPDSVDHDDEDDLPEFDFNSARGVPEAPVGKFPWSDRRSPLQFNQQLPIEKGKNVGRSLPAVPMLTSTEAIQRSQVSSFPEKSFGNYQGISLRTKFGDPCSEKDHEYQASQSLSWPFTVEADKRPSSSKSLKNFPHKIDWDEDDDMPEWCPPGLEHLNVPQPSTTAGMSSLNPKPTSENPVPRPPIPAQSPTSFHQTQNQGLLHGYQPGLLGPHPGASNPAAFVRTGPIAGFVQLEIRPPNPKHSLGPRVSNFEIRPPLDVNRMWRQP